MQGSVLISTAGPCQGVNQEIFSWDRNPTPIWDFAYRMFAMHLSGTVNVWVRDSLFVKDFLGTTGTSSRGVVRTLIMSAPDVEHVNIMVEVTDSYAAMNPDLFAACQEDFVYELELKLRLWKAFSCGPFVRPTPATYSLFLVRESFFNVYGIIDPAPDVLDCTENSDEVAEEPTTCLEGCLSCEDPAVCTECGQGLFLNDQGQCVEDCGPRFRAVEEGAVGSYCELCDDPNCLHCPDNGFKCGVCDEGWYLSLETFTCVQECGDFFFEPALAAPGLTCIHCSERCMRCEDGGEGIAECLRCLDGFRLHEDYTCQEGVCPLGTAEVVDLVNGGIRCINCPENCESCADRTVRGQGRERAALAG